jgi:flagellar protein FlaI
MREMGQGVKESLSEGAEVPKANGSTGRVVEASNGEVRPDAPKSSPGQAVQGLKGPKMPEPVPEAAAGPPKSDPDQQSRSLLQGFVGFFRKESKIPPVIRIAKKRDDDRRKMVDGLKLESKIDLGDRHVTVEVYLNEETSEYIYHSIEPAMAPRQTEVMHYLFETLSKALQYNKSAMESTANKEKFLTDTVKQIQKDYKFSLGDLNPEFMDPVLYFIRRDYIGYGRIQSLMLDPGVEDISCDGTGIPVFVYHRDYGSIRTTTVFDNDEELEGFVVSLAQRAGKNISVAEPILDATLPEGHRLNATFGREVTTRGSSFTIRKFKEDPLTISDLVRFNTISSEMAAHLWLAVQYGESMIFAGGTASGKTATMNATSIFIPTSAKIISIEDTREVNLPHQNWIAGITRGSADSEKSGDIDMYQLLRAALRQRPEYVLVGEVRGKETMTMFQAMATGHITYSTMHADSVKSIVYRLENPPISIPRVLIQALNLVAIHNQLRVKGRRVRRITELVEIVGIEPTSLEIITNRVYKWEPAGDMFVFGGHSNLYEKIMDQEDMTRDEVVIELNRRSEVIQWMVKNEVRQFKDVNTVVSEYYEDSDKVIKLLRENSRIDISKGLHVFDEMLKERLPPSSQEALPPASGTPPVKSSGIGGA